jgi:hypothetical protein
MEVLRGAMTAHGTQVGTGASGSGLGMLSFAIMNCDGGDYEPVLHAQYFLCN